MKCLDRLRNRVLIPDAQSDDGVIKEGGAVTFDVKLIDPAFLDELMEEVRASIRHNECRLLIGTTSNSQFRWRDGMGWYRRSSVEDSDNPLRMDAALEYSGTLDDDAIQRLKESWQELCNNEPPG